MFEKALWVFLGLFLLLFGIFAVTNIEVVWGKPIEGISALIAGVLCIIKVIKSG